MQIRPTYKCTNSPKSIVFLLYQHSLNYNYKVGGLNVLLAYWPTYIEINTTRTCQKNIKPKYRV